MCARQVECFVGRIVIVAREECQRACLTGKDAACGASADFVSIVRLRNITGGENYSYSEHSKATAARGFKLSEHGPADLELSAWHPMRPGAVGHRYRAGALR